MTECWREEGERLVDDYGEACADPFAAYGPDGEPPSAEAREARVKARAELAALIERLGRERDEARATVLALLDAAENTLRATARLRDAVRVVDIAASALAVEIEDARDGGAR